MPPSAATLSGQVHERLLRMILSGELPPGSRLQEISLSARLGVSRTPVREALGRLSEYGVVESRPNHGAMVRRVGREELVHLHQVREAMEGMATALACGKLSDEDFAHLDALAESARDADAAGFLEATDAFDRGLHGLVADRSGNPILAREIRKHQDMTMLIHDQFERVLIGECRINPAERVEIRELCWAQHTEIVAALKTGDADASREAMVAHVRASCGYKLRLLPEDDRHGDEPAGAWPVEIRLVNSPRLPLGPGHHRLHQVQHDPGPQ